MPFEVAYSARIQVDQLDGSDKVELTRLFSDPEPEAMRAPAPGKVDWLVSRLGHDKRVLWHRLESGMPEVLGVVDRSFAAA